MNPVSQAQPLLPTNPALPKVHWGSTASVYLDDNSASDHPVKSETSWLHSKNSTSESECSGQFLGNRFHVVPLSHEGMTNWRTGPLPTPWVPLVLSLDFFLQLLYAGQAWGCRYLHEGQRNLTKDTVQAYSEEAEEMVLATFEAAQSGLNGIVGLGKYDKLGHDHQLPLFPPKGRKRGRGRGEVEFTVINQSSVRSRRKRREHNAFMHSGGLGRFTSW
ncbi:hypothetical protein EYF80_046866 [Liparis tanakae]|uniref:Uncharacterized protein n=1 Tax=Liparis tanakae TaxID=230148 RepID=A0A4Z2FPV8_9TELE|nr:hypothetical protein EYF80_046866 [Liparis tanakae]